ncbi:transcription termination factor MTERF6, chloroplastic/mitochondrial isoform X3 [Telopea speciosissima]|uniref:transcription termination factor MTERF6, chloroplastic/mitochondrial isoform X3 n=1 Tax=Telopea speciosissima TaxID=54955 RepID=UPI001CC7097B|nr:transcription termination factor MTERF6, chloroplastic/mitochondrial isoform X3 [Telopea speciosissima]
MYARNILFPIPKTVKTTVSNDGIYIANLSCNHRFHVKISNAAKSYSEFSPLRRLQFSDTLRRASTTEHCGNSNDEWFVDAQDAVSEIIQESGLSKEESVEIALNSPKYVKMLMDSVRDLDEHSLWKSWEIENEDVGSLPYKRKVFYMAKKKGDNGLLPYLESIGLNPSSSTYVARYLSRETLPDLISKVKYVKEMFFFGSDDEDFIGKNARRMMMHLSITTDEDIQQTLSFFEKVGVANKDIGRMLLKYPWILSTSVLENLEEILSYLDMEKVPKAHVETAIKSWPHLLGCSTSKIKYMVEQFEGLGIKNKKLGQVIASSPQLLLRKPHEFLEMVLFMEELGLDAETIGRIMSRCPEIFASSIERTLRRKVKFLADIGISRDHLPRVIRKYPELLVSDIDSALLPRIRYLMRSGLSKREVASMVRRFSPLLGYSIEEVLRPKLEFLVNTMEKPVRDVVEYPRYFSYSLDKKIKPRFWVLKGRNVDCSLKDMLGKNDEDFATDYMGIGRMLVPPPSSQE